MTNRQIWNPLHVHSQYSLLDGLSKADDIAKRCVELGYKSCALTDHGTLGGAISFSKALKKNDIKPILGIEFYLCEQSPLVKTAENRKLSHLCVLSKNLQGWKKLVAASSKSNQEDNFYFKPRLDLDTLSTFCDGNLIAFSGHPGSDLANILFADAKEAYGSRTYEEAKSYVRPDWVEKVTELAGRYQDIFGKDNFFLEIQLIDSANMPVTTVIAKALRYIGKKNNIECVATSDSHYCRREDAADQRILLCNAFGTTLQQVRNAIDNDEDISLGAFFKSNNYHIPSVEEIETLHSKFPREMDNSLLIAQMCEEYSIFNKASLPSFKCPDNLSGDDYLTSLCRQGWKEKIVPHIDKAKWPEYASRIKEELQVLQSTGLSDYFLIVWDYVKEALARDELIGVGRGSAGGCLTSYLLNITNVDPIKHNLIFERFYNAGRNKGDTIEYPDIDIDFQPRLRFKTLQYIQEKYGHAHVAQICTYSRMMGRSVLKDVLRAHDTCTFDEMNKITEHIPDESKIADDLQAMEDEGNEKSIIRWALENEANKLKPYCYIDEDGSLKGDYAKYFAQAIRLEGTKRAISKHASAVVINPNILEEFCPMIRDKSSKELIIGVDLKEAEAIGIVKFDILGLSLLDKIAGTCHN